MIYVYSSLICILLVSSSTIGIISESYVDDTPIIAIYNGSGSWNISVIAFESFLDWKGIGWVEIDEEDINNGDLDGYQAIYFPGGWAGTYVDSISSEGFEDIRRSIEEGVSYIGICAGAYLAADKVVFENVTYNYPLKIFNGIAYGSLHSITPWDNYTMTLLDINKSNPINMYESSTEWMLYYGGPYFQSYDQDIDVLATWRGYYDKPAIVSFKYGDGRVVLIGSHPEIEEDSFRDGSVFADEYDDNGSDWYLLWTLVDWVIYGEVTKPPQLDISIDKPKSGYLYFLDRELFYMGETIIFGGINIEVMIENYSYYEIENVTFYIDDEIRYIDDSLPYSWFYNDKGFKSHMIRVTVRSVDGIIVDDSETLWMMNLMG